MLNLFLPIFNSFFSGFYLVLTGFDRVLLGFYLVLLGFTGFYWVLPSYTEFLPNFTGFYCVLLGFYRVLLGFTGFKLLIPSFTEFHLILLVLTGSYLVLPRLTVLYGLFSGLHWLLPSILPSFHRFVDLHRPVAIASWAKVKQRFFLGVFF